MWKWVRCGCGSGYGVGVEVGMGVGMEVAMIVGVDMDISCIYTSQVRTRVHPSLDHRHGSDAGPAFTRIRARK